MQWADKKVLVLGLGETGLSLVRWLSAQSAHVRAADSRDLPPSLNTLREQYPEVELRCGVFRSELLDGMELIAASPGVPLRDPLLVKAAERGIPIMGDIELFAQRMEMESRDAANKKPVVIAITGSNGKTTVTSMVGAMCREAGLDTVVAGNISPAVLDVLLDRECKQPDVWVLELSSFQLETTYSLSADAATVLNISEDHLDRYADMGEYIAAKARVFRSNGRVSGVQVVNRDDTNSMGMALSGRLTIAFGLNEPSPKHEDDWGVVHDAGETWLVQGQQRVLNADELQVAGMHNVANALAALALCRNVGLPLRPLLNALRVFKGLPHRVEWVTEIRDVIYYDDSKGTNVGASVAALQGLGRKSVLIAGGDGKGQDFTPLAPAVAQHARAVVLIGRDADKIAEALKDCGVLLAPARDMDDAVWQAAAMALPGDAVLLSPACASFDMFRNYEYRAKAFIAAVQALQQEVSCTRQS
ncbi:MAG: UDP-N-acetylmuramoyl-L-alanine--D-glutamate ligase [Nitrosomonadales bacterium]|nr:UDP-N-acetylmuramoyl-L-alanine--D-glutamate ligase [Nitrosomonadales bacterium]